MSAKFLHALTDPRSAEANRKHDWDPTPRRIFGQTHKRLPPGIPSSTGHSHMNNDNLGFELDAVCYVQTATERNQSKNLNANSKSLRGVIKTPSKDPPINNPKESQLGRHSPDSRDVKPTPRLSEDGLPIFLLQMLRFKIVMIIPVKMNRTNNHGRSYGINQMKLESIQHQIKKLKRLNSNHNEATTDYIASLYENTNPDHRYISEILLASGLLLKRSWLSFDEDEDRLKTILLDDVTHLSENWIDFHKEVPVVALDAERLIFKDLIDEISSSEAANQRAKTAGTLRVL
ncbi:protein of unknown function DUF4378 [Macleaya cordata]|uniref:DUF4378 domain-containing protein n=1 Tax=Macleaya cordata TaxID=56857 RepID=A0A200PRF7_MACCD|nr:protein of unknown function DUF4378 [Macleaya cordata]